MNYLRQHRRPDEKRRRAAALAIVALALLVGILQLAAPSFFPSLFSAIARPFWRVQFAASEGGLSSPQAILAENAELKRELADLQTSIASSSVALLESQNRELIAALNRASTTPDRYVLGAVLARPSFMPYDELIIDAGSDDGISTTSQVYSTDHVLIGKVGALLPHEAKVMLYSSPHESYDVSIGPDHVPATAEGAGGGQYRADVPHGSGIQPGDIVSAGSLYDRAFGVVVSVVTDPSNPFDTVLFAPPVNIYQMRFVLVDTGKARFLRR